MRGTAALVAAMFVLAGCGGGASEEPTHIVVLGSSFPASEPQVSDPGRWWRQFSDEVSNELGVATTYDLLSLGSVQDAVAAVSEPGSAADTIAAADIVLVTVGGNQALPDPDTGIGCTAWFLEAQGPCLDEGVATYGDLYDQLFAGVKALRGDEPTVYALATSYNGNIESPEDVPDGLLSLYVDSGRVEEAKAWAVAAYDRWATMQTERATAAGFQVIDTYRAFNGPDGTAALMHAYLDPDSVLNVKGHNLFAAQLTEVDLSAINGT